METEAVVDGLLHRTAEPKDVPKGNVGPRQFFLHARRVKDPRVVRYDAKGTLLHLLQSLDIGCVPQGTFCFRRRLKEQNIQRRVLHGLGDVA